MTAFALRVVHPFYDADGVLMRYMETGEEVDHFLAIMKGQTGDELAMLLSKGALEADAWAQMRRQQDRENEWDDRQDYVLASATSERLGAEADFAAPAESIPDRGAVLGVYERSGAHVVRGLFPVPDAAGDKVGAVFVERDITETYDALQDTRMWVLVVVAGLGVVIMVALLITLNRLVFLRLGRMIDDLEDVSIRLAGGDYDISPSTVGANDEIGEFERFFNDFVSLVANTLRQLTRK